MQTRHADYRPLTAPIHPTALDAYRRWAKASGRSPASPAQTVAIVMVCVIAAPLLIIFTSILGMAVGSAIPDHTLSAVVGSVVSIGALSGIVCLIVFLTLKARRKGWEKAFRLDQFARANGMFAIPSSPNPPYPGMIFHSGDSRIAYDRVQSASGQYFDIGNYRYTTGSGKNSHTHTWGFIALRLPRRLPQIVLDSTANNLLFGSNLPAAFGKDQILRLEGDFNEHFTLYCPRQYERDALYVFTPDLMALLIDHTGNFDVEIVDDWLFVYSATPWQSLYPAVWERLFTIIHTVGAKTFSQTEYYRDDRIQALMSARYPGQSGYPGQPGYPAQSGHLAPSGFLAQPGLPAPPSAANNFVAPQGRRLKRRTSWIAIAIVVVLPLLYLLQTLVKTFLAIARLSGNSVD